MVKPSIMVVGSYCLDVRVLAPSLSSVAPCMTTTVGGSGWLMARALVEQGERPILASPVGPTPLGRFLKALAFAHGVEVVDVSMPNSKAGIFTTSVSETGHVEVRLLSAEPIWDPGSIRWPRSAAGLELVLVGHVTLDVLEASLRLPARLHCFNPSQAAVDEEGLWQRIRQFEGPCLISANAEEIARLEPSLAADPSRLRDNQVLAVSSAADGCFVRMGDQVYTEPAMAELAIDPVGAGDALAAATAFRLVSGSGLEKALNAGAVAAARSVQEVGSHNREFWTQAGGRQWDATALP